jgi:hypothetical protein
MCFSSALSEGVMDFESRAEICLIVCQDDSQLTILDPAAATAHLQDRES